MEDYTMYITEDGFLFRGTKEQYEADQKARKEQWDQCLKLLEKDKKEQSGVYEDNPYADYEGDKGDTLEDSYSN